MKSENRVRRAMMRMDGFWVRLVSEELKDERLWFVGRWMRLLIAKKLGRRLGKRYRVIDDMFKREESDKCVMDRMQDGGVVNRGDKELRRLVDDYGEDIYPPDLREHLREMIDKSGNIDK